MKTKNTAVLIALIPFILLIIKVMIIESGNYSNFVNWMSLHMGLLYKFLNSIWGILMKILTNRVTLSFWNNLYIIGTLDAIILMGYFILTGGKKR